MSDPLTRALDAIDTAIPASANDAQLLVAAKCRGLMRGYDQQWRNEPWTALMLEHTFEMPIVNPETGRTSRTFAHAGKWDGVVEYHGKPWLLEHKTTSDDIADHNAPYWRRLAIDSQVSGYMLAHFQGSQRLEGTLYDVIRKPTIRPKKVAAAERRAVTSLGSYCGQPMSAATQAALVQGDVETLEMYEARLVADIAEQPERYFRRRSVPRLDSELLEYAHELWDVAQEIVAARRTGRNYRNSDACFNYSSYCEYLGICSGHDDIESGNWRLRENVHSELPTLQGNSLNVLTNSRIRCFQSCRRKHQLRYEMGLERNDLEEKEALYFGSTVHTALEAWWSYFLPNEVSNGDSATSVPANEVGTTCDGQTVVS